MTHPRYLCFEQRYSNNGGTMLEQVFNTDSFLGAISFLLSNIKRFDNGQIRHTNLQIQDMLTRKTTHLHEILTTQVKTKIIIEIT